jgi:hypothetical protein
VKHLGVGAGVGHVDGHQGVGRTGLGVGDVDDPVPVVVEDPGVEQLVLRIEPSAPTVLLQQLFIGKRLLRIVIAPGVPGMTGHRVAIPPVLLDVFTVIALVPVQPEGPLLEGGVAAVPQRQ